MHGFICSASVYGYEGWIFEYGHSGPWPLKKDYSQRMKAGKKFYDMFYRWAKLIKDEKDNTKIGGGCQRF